MRDNEIYHMRLLPWLSGRKDSEISSFETVAQDDTVNALRRM
jgi:hypothetical protein